LATFAVGPSDATARQNASPKRYYFGEPLERVRKVTLSSAIPMYLSKCFSNKSQPTLSAGPCLLSSVPNNQSTR